MNNDELAPRVCFREPITEIAQAARYLTDAVTAHLEGNSTLADKLIRRADMKAIREWTESLWGRNSPYQKFRVVHGAPPIFLKADRKTTRMPTSAEKHFLLQRDGYHCKFCGIPIIRNAVRNRIKKAYPNALPWGRTNATQHAAFQAMWVQYDHLIPHARGGGNEPENMVITCAPCNFGRMNYTLEEVGLIDRDPVAASTPRGPALRVSTNPNLPKNTRNNHGNRI